jgi:Bacterial antitoxin of type II TA system, VapB
MRTTIKIDDGLLAEAKRVAAETDQTLGEVVEEALRERLARRRAVGRGQGLPLPTSGGGGLMPGVDLDNNAALLDLMERDRP